jgi:hypothetical protein
MPKQSAVQNHPFDRNQPPASIMSILEQRSLIWGEAATDYDALFMAILEEIEPITTLQWLHVKHLTDLAWEIHRYRRLKAKMIDLARRDAVQELLTPLIVGPPETLQAYEQESEVRRIANDLQYGSEAKHVRALQDLKRLGITLDDITTQSMVLSLPDVGRVESLIASAEGRMVLLLREVNRLKDDFVARLQKTAGAIQDGTFAGTTPADLEPPQ